MPLSASPFALSSALCAVLVLAFVGGFLDAAFFLALGVFVGLQTGNVAQIAAAIVSPNEDDLAALRAAALGAWIVGLLASAMSSAALARAGAGRRGALAALLAAAAVLLGCALAVGATLAGSLPGAAVASATPAAYATACVGALACGFLPPVLRQLLPFVPMVYNQTGNLISFFDDTGVTVVAADADAEAAARRRRLVLLGATIAGFVAGAFSGAALQRAAGFAALALPIALLLALACDALAARLLYGEGAAAAPACSPAAAAAARKLAAAP